MPSFAVVAAADRDAWADVHLQLQTQAPFPLPLPGIDGHQVFLGAEHAAFVFWGADPESALVQISGHADVRERVTAAAAGLRAPRLLESMFEWQRDDERADRAVALLTRGDERIESAMRAAERLVAARGDDLQRIRTFSGQGTGLSVIERAAGRGEGWRPFALEELEEITPVAPLRPVEVLDQTYWFEGDQLGSRPNEGIIDVRPPS